MEPPVLLRHHSPSRRLGGQPDALQIGVDDLVPIGLILIKGGLGVASRRHC